MAREAIRLFVNQDIDVNMPIFSWSTSEITVKNDIDVFEIISRGEQIYNLTSWI